MIRAGLGRLYRDLEQYFCAFLMVLMVFCLGAQVFFRFVLNASLTWSEELSRFAFIWLVYMGAVLGAKERIHIRVTAFHRLLPARARGWVIPAADLLWVSINLTFAWQGALQVGHLLRFSYISPALQWNMALIYAIVPIGFLLMSFRIVEGYWRDWRRGVLGQVPETLDGGPGGVPHPDADATPEPDTASEPDSGRAKSAAPSPAPPLASADGAGRDSAPGTPGAPTGHEAGPPRPTGGRNGP